MKPFKLLEVEHPIAILITAFEHLVYLLPGERSLVCHPPATQGERKLMSTDLNSVWLIFPSPFLSKRFQAFWT